MMVEVWAALSALFFAAAAVTRGLEHSELQGPWRRIVLPARAAGLVAVAAALALTVMAHGEPSPFDLRQVALGLGLATSAVGLCTTWRKDAPAIGPVRDLFLVSLILAAILAIQPGGALLRCAERCVSFGVYWGLFVLGSGGALFAGSVTLDLALDSIWPKGHRWMARAEAYRLLTGVTLGALVILGIGLSLSVWWSWRAMGSLSGGDPRQTWMGATWLVLSMSLLAWQSERRGARVAGALAVLAASMVLFGLLALPDLQRLWGL
jgi:hypothetical protein